MSTNGHTPAPSRERIIMDATYYAAVHGWYDTSEAAQKANLLTVTVMDMANMGEAPPPGATHRFFVCINATAYFVTRYADGRYGVEEHDQDELQRQERELREAVLDTALWYLTGEGAGYHPDPRPEERPKARATMMKELLEEGPEDEEPREESDPAPHAVVKDELPDLTLSLAPGREGGPGPQPLRQWSVQIGPYNSCEVAFFGYDAEDGSPILVPVEAGEGEDDEEPEDYEEDNEE